jgi:hypothetical protein
MEKKFELLPPIMPNFIRLKSQSDTFPIAKLTKAEAEEYGELMKQEFIKHWKNKAANFLQ